MSAHDEYDDFFGDGEEDAADIPDTRAAGRLLKVPLGRLAPNNVNPREDFGTEDDLLDLGRSLARRQIHAVPVVSKSAYLTLWPEHEEQIGNVDYVIVSGERRFHAATTIGMNSLECVVNDEVAETHQTFLDAVVSENIDRQNFDFIEEARAVEALVAAFGTASAVARHYERVEGWVSQRRILLHLAPAVQDLVRKSEIPLRQARNLAKFARDGEWSEEKQLEWWEEEQRSRAALSAQRKEARKKVAEARPRETPETSQPRTQETTTAGSTGVPPQTRDTGLYRGKDSQPKTPSTEGGPPSERAGGAPGPAGTEQEREQDATREENVGGGETTATKTEDPNRTPIVIPSAEAVVVHDVLKERMPSDEYELLRKMMAG
ncbi:ParB/RepB/Spo0J family partition protein [Streptomyces sp. NPDC060243]|uniref:ParB/RepB/Spo0J family partition protein n=1 Tax=Streptomyces sp. NPDC060243 TaxID=3347081 RepID=UPI003646549D